MKQLNFKQKEKYGKAANDVRKVLTDLDVAFFPFSIAPEFVITPEQKNIFFNAYEEIIKVINEVETKTI